jgi:hypothetical protein
MLHVCNLDVAKVDLDVSVLWMLIPDVATLFSIFFMLQTLILDAADVESRCCRHVLLGVANIFFNVADVAFRCCRHVVLGVVLRRREKRLLMLDVARNTGRNIAATWGGEKKDS